jgi:putative aminopeptidase FrvX
LKVKLNKLKINMSKQGRTELNEEFLVDYLNSNAPVGYEIERGGQKLWMEYIKPFVDKVYTDNYGTAVAVIKGKYEKGKEYKVVIDAHADEIAWQVKYIESNGFLRVERLGGSDSLIAPGLRVDIWTEEKGTVRGVFGFPPIHDHQRNKNAGLDDIFVDVGASSKEAVLEMGIDVGTPMTFVAEAEFLGKDNEFVVARAIDNRIGGFAIAEVARKLHENDIELPYDLYIVNAVQEEVGLRGAEMATQSIKPDVAIVTDVCHATDSPAYNPRRQGDFKAGQGGVIDNAPAVQKNLWRLMLKQADKKKIPYQKSVSARVTGTNTDAYTYSNGGVVSALVSFPLRYMHTTNEVVHKDDVKNVIRTIYHTLKAIENNHDFKYQ